MKYRNTILSLKSASRLVPGIGMRGGPGGRYSQVAMVSLVQKLSFETLFFKLLEFCLSGRISEHAGSKGQKCFTSGKRDQNILSVILKGKMKTK